MYNNVFKAGPVVTKEQATQMGFDAFFAVPTDVLKKLENDGVVKEVSNDARKAIRGKYVASRPSLTPMKALLWDEKAIDTDIPHSGTQYLTLKPFVCRPAWEVSGHPVQSSSLVRTFLLRKAV